MAEPVAVLMEDSNTESVFHGVPQAPDVPIYALMAAFRDDPSPVKLNLGIGVYRTEEGKPLLLKAVKRAEEIIFNNLCSESSDKEYLPPTGSAEFNKFSAEIIFGSESLASRAIKENRVATVQTVSGSGSLRIGAEFLAKYYHERMVYVPMPTYGNHQTVFSAVGMNVKTYRYYDYTTHGLDFQGLLEDLGSAPPGATVLFHLCGHNPTGVDPTVEKWEEIRKLIRSKGLFPFFDCAYQGFVSGDLDADALPVRMFVNDGGECIAAQSYSKIMGIYGERTGALNIVCKTAEAARIVEGPLQDFIRGMYLAPPRHGASIVTVILSDRELYKEWIDELKSMAGRVVAVRHKLFDALCSRGTPGDWSHITKQVGMFSMSGLSKDQVSFLAKEYRIYMPSDGRINIAGLSLKDVPYLADAIYKTVKNTV